MRWLVIGAVSLFGLINVGADGCSGSTEEPAAAAPPAPTTQSATCDVDPLSLRPLSSGGGGACAVKVPAVTNWCRGDYPYHAPPWSLTSSTCYLVNKTVSPVDKMGPGLHQNFICKTTFSNATTGESKTEMLWAGYGGDKDDYGGDNLGNHGIEATYVLDPACAWSVLGSICGMQLAIEAAEAEGKVCYFAGGETKCSRFVKGLLDVPLGTVCGFNYKGLGTPTFNCRDVADLLTNVIKAAMNTCDGKQLDVSVTGTGTGTVNAPAPEPGIRCGTENPFVDRYCAETVPTNTMVTLTATAGLRSQFKGWSGACSGTGPCTVVMDKATRVNAEFEKVLQLRVARAGTGTGNIDSVDGASLAATDASPKDYSRTASTVRFTATPAAGSTFTGWSGACTGTGACTVALTDNAVVTATFDLPLAFGDCGGAPFSSPMRCGAPGNDVDLTLSTPGEITATPMGVSIPASIPTCGNGKPLGFYTPGYEGVATDGNIQYFGARGTYVQAGNIVLCKRVATTGASAGQPYCCYAGSGTKQDTLCCTGGTCGSCTSGCVALTCPQAGANCGTLSNGCNGTLNCGGCLNPQTCGGGGLPNICGGP